MALLGSRFKPARICGRRFAWLSRYRFSFGCTEAQREVAMRVLYAVLMAAVVVTVDFLFFRNRFWERLAVNIGLVLVFAAFYFRFLKRP